MIIDDNLILMIYIDILAGLILIFIGFLILFVHLNLFVYVSLFFLLFFIASPGASAAHLTVSELFPSVTKSLLILFYKIGNAKLSNGIVFCSRTGSRWRHISIFL